MNGQCRNIQIELSGLFDGEVPPERREKLEKHLSDCLQCQMFYRELQQTESIFNLLKSELSEISEQIDWEQFSERVFSSLEREEGFSTEPTKERKPSIFEQIFLRLREVVIFFVNRPRFSLTAFALALILSVLAIPFFDDGPEYKNDCVVEKVESRQNTKVAILQTEVQDSGGSMTVIVINEGDEEKKNSETASLGQ